MVDTRGGRRFAALFFAAAFLVLLLGRWLTPVDHGLLAAAAPFQSAISAIAGGIGDVVAGVVEGPRLRSENVQLRKQVGELLQRNLVLQEQAHENDLLKRMTRFDDRNNRMDLLPGRVIGADPNTLLPSIIINRGRRDGLRSGMTVVDPNGYFVGAISDLTANAAKVQLMISPSLSVAALDLHTRASGLVEGQYNARPQLRLVVASASLRPGDFVVTSGQMNLFPRNLLLGQIVRVDHSNVQLFQTADIQPAADFQDLELVQVVRNFSPSYPAKLISNP